MKLGYECNQQWDKMQDVAGGKYCTLCSKTVFDMRGKTQEEIRRQHRAENNQLCGYFLGEQLDDGPDPGGFNLRIFLAGLVTVFSLNASRSFAQAQPAPTEQHDRDFFITETGEYVPANPPDTATNEKDPEAEVKMKHRRYSRTLFYVGAKRVYISRRFPFLHVGRARFVGSYM